VTFTIGGNDAKFADTLTGCIEAGINPFSQCLDDDDERERVEEDIQRAIDNLRELLPQVRERAPNARILVLGYPRFFPEDPGSGWSDGTQIDTEDILAINDLVADMDAQIEGLVDELNEENPGSFQFVDMYDAFNGCEIGTDNPCMNNIEVRFADGKPDKNGSYHPNDAGHDQMAEILEEAIRNGPS
jgi:lysophospholipase L1-like esterase